MSTAYVLTPELRIQLKKPLGVLVQGSFSETMRWFKKYLDEEKPPFVVSVGDTVSRNLMKSDVKSNLSIIDNLAMRRATEDVVVRADRTIHVANPPGTITVEAINAIKDAIESDGQTLIIVDGEEDLLTLIAVLYGRENAVVLYGQPYEGIVVIRITPEKKNEIERILKTMEEARKAK
jgi:uncharacterized protein (UPF0218 family)